MAAVTPSGAVDVPLSLMSSLDTELSPADIPEGISPDNQDVVYKPGSVSTRPACQRVFGSSLDGGNINYEKSYVMPSGGIKNLYLTSLGNLWVEDVTNLPGVAVLLFQSTATRASSVTAFGREYIALSDGVTGQDIPIQYDGTNLWRVTQDGPGAPPSVASLALPAVAMAVSAVSPAQTISSITTTNPTTIYQGPSIGYVTMYVSITIVLAPGSILPTTDMNVAVAGTVGGILTGSYTVSSVSGLNVVCHYYAPAYLTTTGGTMTPIGSVTMTRSGNTVTVTTASAHSLKIGYQVQIASVMASQVGGGIASIVVNNEDNPGVATVTTNSAHGLFPNNAVNIQGVTPTTAGTAITNVSFNGANLVTVTTSMAHGLSIGSEVTVAAATSTFVNGQWYVNSVPSSTTFTYIFLSNAVAFSASQGGTVTYIWPLATANPAQNYFTVLTAPSATTFTVALSYTDGTWAGGTVTFGWDGTFYVTSVPSATSLTYQQYGPNATSATVGTVTPFGQATPGMHSCQLLFLLASGAITAPSPPVQFIANGGQYISVTDIATGPSNVVSRILQFTGAGGGYYFYIPVPAQVNGLVVSTSTQLNDNTSTSALLDFSDNTLYAAVGTSIPGNNLQRQVVLGPCAGMFSYASRLLPWGERNKVQNFINMGFDGGSLPSAPTLPSGWVLPAASSGGAVATNRLGTAWQVTIPAIAGTYGAISQSAYADAYGNTILLPSVAYKIRVWVSLGIQANHAQFIATLGAASTGFSSTATIQNGAMTAAGTFLEAVFSLSTPSTIPPDLMLTIAAQGYGAANVMTIDEVELIYVAQPYLQSQSRASYSSNPEGFDGLTGIIGPQDDQTAIMNFGVIRDTLYLVTGGALHKTSDVTATEPANWDVEHVADNCGAWSISSIARNAQGIGAAGKEWMTWSGPDGAQIFTGQQPFKISQEIQSLWDAIYQPSVAQCWTKNDQTNKRCYYGVPISDGVTQILVLDYRNLDGEGIASSPPVHISFTGKMIASDLTRKWTKWNVNASCCELMYHGSATPVLCFGSGVAGANAYTLNAAKYTDDDFGQIFSYYTTYFFVSHEMEAALQVGSHRKLYQFLSAYISGVGS